MSHVIRLILWQYFWLFQIFYKFTLFLNKLAFLALYLRLFPTPRFRIVTIATIAVVSAGTCSFVISTVFQCIPVEAYWDHSLGGTCVNNKAVRWSWAAFNTLLDVWVCLMPLPVIHRLQMSPLKKAGVMVLFGLGLFVCVASGIRMVALEDSTTTKDRTWGSFSTLAWSSIEASVGLICTCIPYLRQPLRRLFPRARLLFSYGQGRSTASQQQQQQQQQGVGKQGGYNLVWMKSSRSHPFRGKTFQRSRGSDQTESQQNITRPDSPVKVEVCHREDGEEED